MHKQIHFLNGKFVTEEQLLISARDLGFTRGYVVFEYLRTYDQHKPFMLKRHLDRLFHSALLIGLVIPWSKEEIAKWINETLANNAEDQSEKTINVIISGGKSFSMIPPENPTIIIIVDPCPIFPRNLYDSGGSLISVKYINYHHEAKTNDYIQGVKQAQSALSKGALEPLFYDDTQVYECSKSTIFAVIDNKLRTPKSHILKGITREILLEIIHLDIPIVEQDFKMEELLHANEVFITGSVKEIVPIVKIDEIIIGDGKVGEVTKDIIKQYHAFIQSNKWMN